MAAAGVTFDPDALGSWIANAAGARTATVERLEPLAGGAIQQTLALDIRIDGEPMACVLRADAATRIAESRTRAEEFALLRVAFGGGVRVPEPLWLCADPALFGRTFFVMRRALGTASGRSIVRDERLGGDRSTLAARLGEQLARIHAIRPPSPELAFLDAPSVPPSAAFLATARETLDGDAVPRPALEWGLRWLDRNSPPSGETVLCHRDFRTGNYMLDEDGITAILDWEFAGWGDRHEDAGWLCAKCWRFGAIENEAGGVGSRAEFFRGYKAASGVRLDPEAVRYWEIFAHARWATIAIHQANRHLSGGERSLELALTASIVPELEYELLKMVG